MSRRDFARIRIGILLLVGVLMAVTAAGTVQNVLNDRSTTLDVARRQAETYARVMEEHAARTFGEADRVLSALAARPEMGKAVSTSGSRAIRDLFQAELLRPPQIRSILVTGPDGKVTAGLLSRHGIGGKAANFIRKPFNRKDLVRKIEDLLATPPSGG